MDYTNTDKMLSDNITDFNKYVPSMVTQFNIFPDGNILDMNTKNIIMIDDLEKSIKPDMFKFLEEKLKIKYKIENENISEFKSGADKILEDEKKSYGFKLTIKVNENIFHQSSYCTDDYKYNIGTERAKIEIHKNIKVIINSYFKIIMHTFLEMSNNKKFKQGVQQTDEMQLRKLIPVYGGKKNK